MVAGWLAAKWSRPSSNSRHALTGGNGGGVGGEVLKPWIWAFWARLGMAGVAALVVKGYPRGGVVGNGYFGVVVATILAGSLARWVISHQISAT